MFPTSYASCFIDEIPWLNEHAILFLLLWVISTYLRDIDND